MTFSKKEMQYALYVLLYVNLINIVFILLDWYGLMMLRPLIIFDYLFVAVAISFRIPAWIVWILFVIIFFFDCLLQASFIFLFSVTDFIKTFGFITLYNFSLLQYFYLGLGALFLLLNYVVIKRLVSSPNISTRPILFLISIFFVLFFLLDVFSGDNLLNENRFVFLTHKNIGGSLLKPLILSDVLSKGSQPKRIDSSITMKTFASDTTGSQLVIIIESWGISLDSSERAKLFNRLRTKAMSNDWVIQLGTTHFQGTTTSAELRELVSVNGGYQYFINTDSAKNFKSIFKIKKEQGYTTIGVHSFSGKMFKRVSWWKNLNIDSCYFMEDILAMPSHAKLPLNYSTPFPSVDDEVAFSIINTPPIGTKKKFGYLLTENSHLPFQPSNPGHRVKDAVGYDKLSIRANDQLGRVQEIIFYVMEKANKKVWSKILIVGDHMPPHTNKTDRQFYSNNQVPYIILSKESNSF